jgi:diaminopimelate decarboxylase
MALRPQYDAFCRKTGRKIELWFEPGRFLVGESGILLTQVKVLKTNGSVDFAGVDSGFNHLIRPMFYDSYHEILNISNPEGKLKRYTVVGNLCEIDNFAKNRPLNDIREGDILAITHAGGYGYSMASQYNSRFRPAEVMISGDSLQLIRKRDTLDDLLRNQIEINLEKASAW